MPVILDAGVGTASDAALAMELGCDARAVRQRDLAGPRPDGDGPGDRRRRHAGLAARGAGRIPRLRYARASTTAEGLAEL